MSFRDKVYILAALLIGALVNQVACGILGTDWGRVGVASKPGNHYERNPALRSRIFPRGAAAQVGAASTPIPQKVDPIKSLIEPWAPKRNETSAERMERVHRAFEKMLTLVNIASQVDDYVSSKVKTVVKKVSGLVDSAEIVSNGLDGSNRNNVIRLFLIQLRLRIISASTK